MDAVTAYIRRHITLCADRIHVSVRPLGVFRDGVDPEPAGSAVLLWHRGHRFLVTAGHVVDGLPPRESAIGTMTRWVRMPGPWRATRAPRGDRDKDRFDIAFTPVSDEGAALLDGCEFLTGAMIGEPSPVIYDGHRRAKYVLLGYPLNKFEYHRSSGGTSTPYQPLATSIASEKSHVELGVSPATHIACSFDHKAIISERGIHSAPKLVGMSGGGMFRYPALEAPGVLGLPMLAGIIIEQDRQKNALIATRIHLVQRAIEDAS